MRLHVVQIATLVLSPAYSRLIHLNYTMMKMCMTLVFAACVASVAAQSKIDVTFYGEAS
jgi:hypothetical protein